MRNLLDFLARHNHWFLFVALEVMSFVLLFRYNSYQGSVWFSSASAVAGRVYEVSSTVSQYFSLVEVNRSLTERNIMLERQLSQMTEALGQERADTAYVKEMRARVLDNFQSIPARVVGNSLDKLNNFITIDKGEADGVRKDMGVVCGTGIVGIVYLTSAHYAVVIPVLSTQSNISCAIRGRGYFGYLHWKGGAADEAYMDDVPRHAHFRLGDWVVTSGYSSVFPPGVLVGRVLHVYNSEDGLSYRVKVKLSTDFGRLRDVCVINDKAIDEKLQLLQAAEDSTKTRQ